jgi:putative redox protein
MEVKVSHLGQVRFNIQSRSHSILCDQPIDNGGGDTAMTPPELMLASLGSCAAYYAVQYLKSRNLADSGVEVSVTAEKLKGPSRLGNFKIQVNYPVALNEQHTEGLARSVKHCLIHSTLLTPPNIDIVLAAREPVAV